MNAAPPDLSFVIPALDEAPSLARLVARITATCAELGRGAEILLVDDGSRDDTWARIHDLVASGGGTVHGFRLRRNFGKATALQVGFQHARGALVVTMDADLQDDPAELPKLLARLEEGYDVVSGYKAERKDPWSKRFPSRVFNAMVRGLFGIALHDINCGFKVYRRAALEHLHLYGELHRFIPVLVADLGFRVGEVPVVHHPREFGHSKYGFSRLLRGFFDLLTVLAITRYLRRPAHLFGLLALANGVPGVTILAYLSVLWVAGHGPIGNRPLFFLGILLVILSVQFVSLGLLGELINRRTDAPQADQFVTARAGCPDSAA